MNVYNIEIGQQADAQLAKLDTAIGASVERKISWLGQNAATMLHRRLVGMPDELSGLCKLRIGDYRILYWIYHDRKLVRLYRIQHRSEVYRDF
ncbi:MAG: type II toxin-antitoxin system RelE family toxin [Limisphaerales bacterium]